MVVAEANKSPYEEPSDAVLAHYGIKGMRWGKRKGGDSSSSKSSSTTSNKEPESTDYSNAKKHSERAKASGTKSLSNKELQDVVTRMNLEQQYSKLNGGPKKSRGQDYVKKMMADNAKQIAGQYAQKGVKLGVEYAIKAAKNR